MNAPTLRPAAFVVGTALSLTFVVPAAADLSITITEGVAGGSQLDIVGSGLVRTNGGTGSLINIGTDDDSFVVDGAVPASFGLTPDLTLGDATTDTIGIFDQDSVGFNSRIALNFSGGGFLDFETASDLSGSYQSDAPFSLFVPGIYSPTLRFVSDNRSATNIGDITLTVVPEPATAALLAGGGLLLMARRRHRRPR